jgi:hypothetical protein
MDPVWVTDIRDQCIRAGVPFFFKQWGGRNKKKAGRLLEGQTWSQIPAVSIKRRPRDRGDGLEVPSHARAVPRTRSLPERAR